MKTPREESVKSGENVTAARVVQDELLEERAGLPGLQEGISGLPSFGAVIYTLSLPLSQFLDVLRTFFRKAFRKQISEQTF